MILQTPGYSPLFSIALARCMWMWKKKRTFLKGSKHCFKAHFVVDEALGFGYFFDKFMKELFDV